MARGPMGAISNKDDHNASASAAQYGVEVPEVDFSEFDRRKMPRLSTYDLYVKSLDTAAIEIEFII